MGFSFRKSYGFKGLRLNFSKSGIGISAGVKGAHISFGSRGGRVSVGADGLYYRKDFGTGKVFPAGSFPQHPLNDLEETQQSSPKTPVYHPSILTSAYFPDPRLLLLILPAFVIWAAFAIGNHIEGWAQLFAAGVCILYIAGVVRNKRAA